MQVPHADGIVRMPNGEIQELEFCNGLCEEEEDHIWLVYDGSTRFGGEDGNDTVIEGDRDRMMLTGGTGRLATDRQGPIIISMFVYYTTDFKNAVPDVKGFIDQVGVSTVSCLVFHSNSASLTSSHPEK